MTAQLAESGLESNQVIESLRSQLEARDTQLLETKTKATKFANELAESQSARKQLESQLLETVSERDALASTQRQLSEKLNALQTQLTVTEEKTTSLEQTRTELTQSFERLTQDHSQLISRFNYSVDKLAAAEKQGRELECTIFALQDDLAQMKEEKEMMSKELQIKLESEKSAQEQVKSLNEELSR